MATFIIDPNGNKIYQKLYQDRDYMMNQFLVLKHTAKQIAKDNNISYKLVNTWLVKHGIIADTPELKKV